MTFCCHFIQETKQNKEKQTKERKNVKYTSQNKLCQSERKINKFNKNKIIKNQESPL